jgi:Tle cognate immunity protein 4 C-terminal domain
MGESGALVALFGLFVLGAVLTACRSHPVHQPTKTIYGGRFRLDIPTEFTLRGEGGFVKGVDLIGVALPAASSLAAARDAFWKDHLAEVRRQTRRHQLPPILEEGELRPAVPKLVYLGYDEDDLAHEALLTDPGRGVIVKAAWRQSYKPEDRPAENTERVQAFHEVVNAFSFLPADYAAADREAYYVKEGMVRITYAPSNMQHPEHYEIGFNGTTQRMKFTFEYQYPDMPSDNRPGLLERAAKAMLEWGRSGRSLRSGHRVVGGFSGQESVFHGSDEEIVGFAWMYEPAAAAKGFQPSITISGKSKDGDVPAVLALWDQILDSVQRLVP